MRKEYSGTAEGTTRSNLRKTASKLFRESIRRGQYEPGDVTCWVDAEYELSAPDYVPAGGCYRGDYFGDAEDRAEQLTVSRDA